MLEKYLHEVWDSKQSSIPAESLELDILHIIVKHRVNANANRSLKVTIRKHVTPNLSTHNWLDYQGDISS